MGRLAGRQASFYQKLYQNFLYFCKMHHFGQTSTFANRKFFRQNFWPPLAHGVALRIGLSQWLTLKKSVANWFHVSILFEQAVWHNHAAIMFDPCNTKGQSHASVASSSHFCAVNECPGLMSRYQDDLLAWWNIPGTMPAALHPWRQLVEIKPFAKGYDCRALDSCFLWPHF